ncbi:MAG: tRNA (guanosine(46)-N7)-methyltransferase TrmB [Clostridia bacterium]|nr:tRNA (guanosine(46)-N7)-methyltransferase TrmB [Clostridia bacterium]MBQ8470083.1 tRNA (guanosine(46)-N7)-methyltransferase TrmB [Clostridia bacterium]MBR1704945.1 tRNA (guanosine(46)-N7)-methyltransferase TrmB [Clostridia bacterium]
MRMRNKKNLKPRLEAVADYLLDATSEDPNAKTAVLVKEYFDYEAIFGNDHPVYLEVGCGKGQFIVELAARHPEYNYIAVEKVANVIVTAAERAKEAGLQNVKFALCGAEYLPKFLPEQSIAGIYLNFSCPYPKNTYANHRLTNQRFLVIYKELLAPGAVIEQKTDNMHFFEYSLEEFTKGGYRLQNISLDLHHSDFEGNIVTEYEQRFSSQGYPIYRLEAYLPEA